MILDGASADCTILGDPDKSRDLTTVDMIGYACFSPEDQAKVANHHDALHTELNKGSK